MRQGLVQVYTGEGKGKTTAALGLAVRALGQGWRVLLVRLLKPAEPAGGEVLFLGKTAGVEILTSGIGIVGRRPDPEEVAQSVAATLATARKKMLGGGFDLVILDEVNNAVHRRYLPLSDLLALIDERPPGTELILTGRHAHPEVIAQADLVTRMEKVKHPLDAGIPARSGIEY